jgi:hypothetical protein
MVQKKICALIPGKSRVLCTVRYARKLSEDQGHTDDVCPPDDEGADVITGTVDIQVVPGVLEVHYLSSEACEKYGAS